MRVLVVVDGTFFRTSDGAIYSQGVYGYSFFQRYLDVFESVAVLARISDKKIDVTGMKRADGERVSFLPLPTYKGPIQYLTKRKKVKDQASKIINGYRCAILRVPSATAQGVYSIIHKKMPIALEVVVDPWEYFAPHTINKWYRPIIRVLWTMQLKKMCKHAEGVSYVTQKYLQQKYPCQALQDKQGYYTASYSSVEIKNGSIAQPRKYKKEGRFHFVHVAVSFATEGKGHRVLIRALKKVIDQGYNADVTFIGDGPLKSSFEQLSKELGLGERVIFTGRLPGADAVRAVMGNSDVFVFPTRAEGLPRVLIEAMAEGLPCISTPVCGIPEILESQWMYNYDDIEGFANRMIYCINNPDELSKQSKRNIEIAKSFENSVLSEKRNMFYKRLCSSAQEHII